MNWDTAGRLWVVCSSTYPQLKPGAGTQDQIIVLEDTDKDGKADKKTVFANDLHIPTALIPGDGGVYVANSTEVLFMKDTNDDLIADERKVILSGFGTEDTHHLVHTMRHGPEGFLYFLQSVYIHSHVETPYGVRRLLGGGVWEFRPETRRLEVISKGLSNPWGFEFDHWGQSFACDGAGSEGINFIFADSVFTTSPGASRIMKGMNPGQPKQCGLEIIEESHFPAAWQGSVILNDFRGNRVNRFTLTPSGSHYTAQQQADVLVSTHRAFRPVDVKTGPDGALYIADWYNPIIQHGEVDFRDPRRDQQHGRIWRITVKGQPLSQKPDFIKADATTLCQMLASPRRYVRHFAKRELRERGKEKSLATLEGWSTTQTDPHILLELAWAREGMNHFSIDAWNRVWQSKNAQARAAALRILTHRWKEVPNPLQILAEAVQDKHPQVRLWAVALANQMRMPEAVKLALQVLEQAVDEPIDFSLEQLCRNQAPQWLPAFLSEKNSIPFQQLIYALNASNQTQALPLMLEMLATSKLSAAQSSNVFRFAANVMNAEQAADLAQQVNLPAMKEQRGLIFESLLTAAKKRKIIPNNAAEQIQSWLTAGSEPTLQAEAAHLAGAWQLQALRPQLVSMLQDVKSPATLRSGAIKGLAALGGTATRDVLRSTFTSSKDLALKLEILTSLGTLAPVIAAQCAAELLSSADQASTAPVMNVVLGSKQMPQHLATALKGKTLPQDTALEAMRMATTRGVQGPLEEALKAAGNIKQMNTTLSPAEMTALVAAVKEKGDAKRGEDIYRRQELTCIACHAIGETGGLIGPNLVSIGASAQVDYLIESLLEPSKKIKEGYHMIIATTKDGRVISGGLVTDGDSELIIRDPANQLLKVAKADIASQVMSPISMMPAGLTASLRQDEFIDLVKFLSELGREGPFKTQPTRLVRHWRVMSKLEKLNDSDHLRHVGLTALSDHSYPFPWQPVISRVDGSVPLGAPPFKKFWHGIAQFSLKLEEKQQVKLRLSHIENLSLVVNDQIIKGFSTDKASLDLTAGTHHISLVYAQTESPGPAQPSVEILTGNAVVLP
jgi:putative heme-binding domain-containing protein